MIPKFSIIVPCFNLAPWIGACLDSVLAQSFSDWECVVVDDESKDASSTILDEYAKRDSRVRVIYQKNKGEGGSRNTGLATAKGEWVFFLDGDDVMAPGALQKLESVVRAYPSENLIRFGYADFKDGGLYPEVDDRIDRDRLIDISKRISQCDYYVYVWQFLFRRSLLSGLTFKRYKRGTDRVFIVSVLCNRVDAFVAINQICYFYRQRQGSAMNSHPSVQVLKDELSHRVDMLEIFDRCGKEVLYARTWAFEHYILEEYLELVEKQGAYSDEEQCELMDWFYQEQARISSLKGFTRLGHLQAKIYGLLPGRTWRKFVKTLLPRIVGSCMIAIRNPKRALRAVLYRIGII